MTVESSLSGNLIPCACGCGNLRTAVDKKGRPRQYIYGHCIKGRFYKGFKHKEESKRKMSENRRADKHHNWKGGRFRHEEGYVYVYSPNHPYATKDGYVFEHRLVMEKYLGRYLIPNIDDVHHINGITDDNRIENLQYLKHGEHSTLTHTKDYSNVICSICMKKTTHIKKSGRPIWHRNKEKKKEYVCKWCYDRLRQRRKCNVSESKSPMTTVITT